VSEPGGSFLAPDKGAVGIGCRGFASIDLHISTFVDKESDAYKTEVVHITCTLNSIYMQTLKYT
jgi:hypothetical protein